VGVLIIVNQGNMGYI